jgi:hypothetical protein
VIARALAQGYKGLSYAALAAFAGSFAIIGILSAADLCSRVDQGRVVCETLVLSRIAEAATAVILLSVFTLAPLVLAMSGLIFLVRGVIRRRRARPYPSSSG